MLAHPGHSHDATMNQHHAIATARQASGPPHSARYPRYRRSGPVAGLTGLACYTAGSLTAGLPGPGTSTKAMTVHLAASRGSVLAGIALMFLALPFLLVFVGFLGELLVSAEGRPWLLAFSSAAAWLTLFALIAVGVIPLAAVAWRGPAATPPGTVRLAADIANLSLYALSAPVAAASAIAPAIVIWRTGALPRWLAVVALMEVSANAAELAGLAATNGADAGGYAAGVGPVIWVLWAAALAATALAAKPRTADPSSAAAATPPNGPAGS